jgi:hypothetical protein
MLIGLATALPLLAGCGFHWNDWERASRPVQERVAHVEGAPIEIRSSNGRVEVIATPDRADVSIDATLRCVGKTQAEADERVAAASLDVARDPDGTLRVRPVFPARPGRQGGDGASITVRLPDGHGADLRTSNGTVQVAGLSGALVIDTSNGTVLVDDHDGSARIDTSNARVVVTNQRGELHLKTSNGRVEVRGHEGPAVIDTSNASVTVELVGTQAAPIRIDTSNGSITFRAGSAFVGTLAVDTSNGGISITDPAGRVRSYRLDDGEGEIVVGEGGPRSRLDTSNASIRLVLEG